MTQESQRFSRKTKYQGSIIISITGTYSIQYCDICRITLQTSYYASLRIELTDSNISCRYLIDESTIDHILKNLTSLRTEAIKIINGIKYYNWCKFGQCVTRKKMNAQNKYRNKIMVCGHLYLDNLIILCGKQVNQNIISIKLLLQPYINERD